MATAIPDLWPEYIVEQVVTPRAILRAQAASLKSRTGGLLEAEVQSDVSTVGGTAIAELRFVAKAPSIQYRAELFVCTHSMNNVYPVEIESVHFSSIRDDDGEGPSTKLTADDQDDLISTLQLLFSAPSFRSTLQSMIALSNEATGK